MRMRSVWPAVLPFALLGPAVTAGMPSAPATSSLATAAARADGADAGAAGAAKSPTVAQEFTAWGPDRFSTDDLWQKNGDWTTSWSKNLILMANATVSGGTLRLRTPAGKQQSGEIQSAPLAPVTFSYGYYQTRMKVAPVAGVCVSFFFIATDYGLPEVDVEFLTDEPWLTSASSGTVHLSVHKDNGTVRDYRVVTLPFNPAKGWHTYGFVIAPLFVSFDVDGTTVWRDTLPAGWAGGTPKGFVMANSWTGNPDWGGGPPKADAVTSYDWMRYYAGATSRVTR